MIRVSVMAKDSFLVQAIASILAAEIGPNVLRLTYLEPSTIYEVIRDHRSVLINVDDGEVRNETITVLDLIRDDSPLLVLMISLRSRNIHIFESYPLANPEMEHVVNLVRDFSGTYLRNKNEEAVTWAMQKKLNGARPRAADLSPACIFLQNKTSHPSDARPLIPDSGFHEMKNCR